MVLVLSQVQLLEAVNCNLPYQWRKVLLLLLSVAHLRFVHTAAKLDDLICSE